MPLKRNISQFRRAIRAQQSPNTLYKSMFSEESNLRKKKKISNIVWRKPRNNDILVLTKQCSESPKGDI